MSTPRLARNLAMGIGLLVAVAAGGRFVAWSSRSHTGSGQRIPALDGFQVETWLGPDCVIAGPVEERFCSEIQKESDTSVLDLPSCPATGAGVLRRVDLRSGLATTLPMPPPLPTDTAKFTYLRSWPRVSPDGRWILYLERRETNHVGSGPHYWPPITAERWRLISTTGQTSRLIPADGSFLPVKAVDGQKPGRRLELRTHITWLPDSQCWSVHRLLGLDMGNQLLYWCVSEVNRIQGSVPRAGAAWPIERSFWYGGFLDGRTAWLRKGNEPRKWVLELHTPGKSEATRVPLRLPEKASAEQGVRWQDFRDSSQGLMMIVPAGDIWGSQNLWALSPNGGPARYLGALPIGFERFSVSTDETRMIYHKDGAAYLKPLR